jgi:hypothetical protein
MDNVDLLSANLGEMRAALTRLTEDQLKRAAPKFAGYPDAIKVVLLDLCGENDFLSDEDLRELVGSARCPDGIDQVWVSEREWVSLTDYDTVYRRVR